MSQWQQEDFEKVTQSKLDSKTHQALMLTICERCILGSATKMAAAQKVLIESGRDRRETNGTATEGEGGDADEASSRDREEEEGEESKLSQLKTLSKSLSARELESSIREKILESSKKMEEGGVEGRENGETEVGEEDKENGLVESGETEEGEGVREGGEVRVGEEGRENGLVEEVKEEHVEENGGEVVRPQCQQSSEREEEVEVEVDGERGGGGGGQGGGEERLAEDEVRSGREQDRETEPQEAESGSKESAASSITAVGGPETESTENG